MRWILILFSTALLVVVTHANELNTVNGITQVVVPAAASPAEQFAADELARYIGKMTGAALPVIAEDSDRFDGRALVVGRTTANLRDHNPDNWARDTIYLGYGDGDIAIIGQGPQGTLFAAYEFLRHQGCRWYLPDHIIDEIVPRRAELELPESPLQHTPTFVERGWHPHPSSPGAFKVHINKWATRNGINAICAGTTFDYGEELGHGLRLREGHTLPALIPSADFPQTLETFAAHPDWYPLHDGRRVHQYKDGRPVQACLSNPEVAAEVSHRVISWLNEYGDCWRFSVSHSDEPTYWCECDACKAMDGPNSKWQKNDLYDAYGLKSKQGPGPLSRRWVTFVNQVAEQVAAVHPDIKISFYAYGSTVMPPTGDDWKLAPNIIVEYAYGDGICLGHDLTAENCPTNAAAHAWLSDWATAGRPVIMYDYPPGGGNFDVPTGHLRRYQTLLRYSQAHGVIAWAGEGQGSWAGSGLWHYLKGRLLWDVNSDVSILIAEFCHDIYGPAETTMQSFYVEFEAALDQIDDHQIWGSWITALPDQDVDRLSALLSEAETQAPAPPFDRHVAMMRAAFNTLEMQRLATAANESGFARYNKMREATLALVERHNLPITDRWRDELAKNPYRPPFKALNASELLDLESGWKFRVDDSDTWRDIRVDDYWTGQGINYHGIAWYTTEFVVPDDIAGGTVWLLFGMIDGDSEVWVNGKSLGSMPGAPWDKPKAFVITETLEPGATAQVRIRVSNELYAAGINGGVRLVHSR